MPRNIQAKSIHATLLVLLIISSCKYRPYLKYYFPSKKTHFPHFTKWEKESGSNHNPNRSAFDITCYDWLLQVNPDTRKIKGKMKMYFDVREVEDSILLDLERHIRIDNITSNYPIKKISRKKDSFYILFKKPIDKYNHLTLDISYHGSPIRILGYTTINYKKDKNGKPFISTATEGIGPHHMMPCKNLLSDEPDSAFIRITCPAQLMAVANGKLDSIVQSDNKKTFHWSIKNPINIYNLSFNIGDYTRIEKDYTDITGIKRKIEAYVLSYNKQIADSFYTQAPIIMNVLENLYGAYPWWNDGCKFIESSLPNGLCMEHQSGISMGGGYIYNYKKFNLTLVHELAHEWWGNSITGYDYGDIWIHEGFATYSEVLFVEKLFGKKDYFGILNYYSGNAHNDRPIIKPNNVRYNSLIHPDDDVDIYGKAALFIHTLRMQLNNDSLFFHTLKNISNQFSKKQISTQELLSYFNIQTKNDFSSWTDIYLKQTTPPTLLYKVTTKNDSTLLEYKWENPLPSNINLQIPFYLNHRKQIINPSLKFQSIKFPMIEKYSFDLLSQGYIVIKKVK